MLLRDFIAQVKKDTYAPISEDFGINIRSVVNQLPESHLIWDEYAKNIPDYIASFQAKEIFHKMPILHATEEDIPNDFLLRASIIVTGFAHAYYYPQSYNEQDPLPNSIMIPLLEIAKRINKKNIHHESEVPVYIGRTFVEDFLANWKFINESNEFVTSLEELNVDKLRLLIPYFDNPEESISTLVTGPAMQAKFSPVFACLIHIQEELFKSQPEINYIVKHLDIIKDCITETTKSFMLMSPKLGKNYVDQVIWSKTTPSMGKIHPNEAPNTGADSLVFHLLDKLIARKNYESILGKSMLYRFNCITENYQKCVEIIEDIGKQLFHFVENNHNELLRDSYKNLVLAYTGHTNSLLESHRKKAYGYAKMAFLSGRLLTNGNQEGNANTVEMYQSKLTPWGKLHRSFQAGKKERLEVLNRLQISYEQPVVSNNQEIVNKGAVFKRYEISKYNHLNNSLAIFNDKVYNLNSIIKTHPGGHRVIQSIAGTDMSCELYEAHANNLPQIEALLKKYLVGYIETNVSSQEINTFVNRWSTILFLITDIQNNLKGIWHFDKEQVGDSKRKVPFHFVMKTLDILFGKDGYMDSLFKMTDETLHATYQTQTLSKWPSINILELGKQAIRYGKEEIKEKQLTTVEQTLIQNMRVYNLYSTIINHSWDFLEKIKLDIIEELQQVQEPINNEIIPNIFRKEFNLFLQKIDSNEVSNLIYPSNGKSFNSNQKLIFSAACIAMFGIAAHQCFKENNISNESFILFSMISIAGLYHIYQNQKHHKASTDINDNKINLCPLGFS